MKVLDAVAIVLMSLHAVTGAAQTGERWSESKANYWYLRYPWIVGCNFIPSTAVNQLEMWQVETFDPATIERELRWASGLGFNTVRVYLHDLVWVADREGFKGRISKYLDIAEKCGVKTVFVLLDDCWNPTPKQGPQPAPVPGVHNSGWVQSPGSAIVNDADLWPRVERYVKDVVRSYGTDQRVLFWDLYNEPGNSAQGRKTLPLLQKVFVWAREVQPLQPLTAAVYGGIDGNIADFLLENSDIITFHNYEGSEELSDQIKELKELGRPVICTEWMARTRGSRIETHLAAFKKELVGCLNWGLVAGKTQTIYPWGSKEGSPEPAVWFHDLLRVDGRPYDSTEVLLLRQLTGKVGPGQ